MTAALLALAAPWLGSVPVQTQLHRWRYSLLRERLADLRGGAPSTNHAAVAAWLPSMDAKSLEVLRGRFEVAVRAAGL